MTSSTERSAVGPTACPRTLACSTLGVGQDGTSQPYKSGWSQPTSAASTHRKRHSSSRGNGRLGPTSILATFARRRFARVISIWSSTMPMRLCRSIKTTPLLEVAFAEVPASGQREGEGVADSQLRRGRGRRGEVQRAGLRDVAEADVGVAQAAEAFAIWRGVTPDTSTVLRALRDRAPG